MSPKGNRTGKGGTPKVGGPQSRGTVLKPIRFSVEMVKRIEKKIGKEKSFSDYVRGVCASDLPFITDKEKDILKFKSDDPLIKKGQSVIKSMVKSRKKVARIVADAEKHGISLPFNTKKEKV
jgi:hypothetical protein